MLHLAKAVMRVSHRLGSSFVDPSSFWKEALPNTECTCACALKRLEAQTGKACANPASIHIDADRPRDGIQQPDKHDWLVHVWLPGFPTWYVSYYI